MDLVQTELPDQKKKCCGRGSGWHPGYTITVVKLKRNILVQFSFIFKAHFTINIVKKQIKLTL